MGLFINLFILNISLLVLYFSYWIYNEIEFNVNVIDLPLSSNAKCLDGSNYRFQFIKGFNEGANKFMLYFEGGGYCGGLFSLPDVIESCKERSGKPLGRQGGKIKFTISQYQNLFSNRKEINPPFYNWNKVYLHYCDGLGFISNNDSNGLYFRGKNNTLGVIDYLKSRHSFVNAESVVLSGFSTGGMAALIYANYISNITKRPNNTYVITDSFFIFDITDKTGKKNYLPSILSNVIKHSGNNTVLFNSYCSYNGEERWKCLIPESFIHNINVPILFLQNIYDSWMINRLGRIDCVFARKSLRTCTRSEAEHIKQYGNMTLNKIKQLVESNDNISAWLPHTIGHIFTMASNIMQNDNFAINNITIMEMITTWFTTASVNKSIRPLIERYIASPELNDNFFKYKDFTYYAIVYHIFELGGFHY